MSRAHPTGIRDTGAGWQAYVRVKGRLYSKRFPRETPIRTMKDWRAGKALRVKAGALDQEDAPTFEEDAADYLMTVISMPSFSDRALHIGEWARHFAGRTKERVTALEIRARLEALLAAGAAPSTVNKRRTALQAFYTRLNGRAGYNPVRDVKKYREDVEIRAQSMWTAYRLLACMRPSQTRARLRVLLWTGWPHAQIARLRPEHLDLAHSRAYVTPRRKGGGKAGAWLPLLPGAIVALREFIRWECFTPIVDGKRRPFSHSSMFHSFRLALAKLNAHRAALEQPPVRMRPYDFRHIFGTMLAERISDDRAIQELMLHSRAEQTRRYTEAATRGRVHAAIDAIVAGGVAGHRK